MQLIPTSQETLQQQSVFPLFCYKALASLLLDALSRKAVQASQAHYWLYPPKAVGRVGRCFPSQPPLLAKAQEARPLWKVNPNAYILLQHASQVVNLLVVGQRDIYVHNSEHCFLLYYLLRNTLLQPA